MRTKISNEIMVAEKEMIPGNMGMDCPYNGEHGFEICCDECDYLKCCIDETYPQICIDCSNRDCAGKIYRN